uniref:Uncharacterized protein n=1 Tax=Timema monikensis TaxID=170555 RepID=A0A7R9E9J4_9NEOP|nr:unnamed protein product [Timema monikensis]
MYSSSMASLVLTDSSQLTALKSYQTKLCIPTPNHMICKNMCLAAATSDGQNLVIIAFYYRFRSHMHDHYSKGLRVRKEAFERINSLFEGAKLIVSNGINNHFQLSHTFTLSSEGGSGYRFGGTYVGTKMIGPNEAYPILQGDMDARGNINSTVIHQFGPKLTSRLSAQIQNGKLSASQLTNDYKGDNCTCSLALANLDISKRAGVFVAHYLQSVSSSLALGSELVYQCGRNVPGGEMTLLSAVARYSLGDIVVIKSSRAVTTTAQNEFVNISRDTLDFAPKRGVASPLSELSIMEWGLVLVLGVDRKLSLPDTEPGPRGDLPIDIPYGARPILELERIF